MTEPDPDHHLLDVPTGSIELAVEAVAEALAAATRSTTFATAEALFDELDARGLHIVRVMNTGGVIFPKANEPIRRRR